MLRRSVSKLTNPCPLDALAAHINKEPVRAACFHRHYTGKFIDTWRRDHAVLFFTPKCLERCEKRQVPAKYDPSLFSGGHDVDWSKLVVVNGPTGSGKTCFGLFGLTTPEQLLVYVSTPPLLQSRAGSVSAEVAKFVAEAAVHQRIADDPATVDPWARDDAVWAARRFYKDALLRHILDVMKKRVGERTLSPIAAGDQAGGHATVDVVLFFDGLGGSDSVEQRAVRDVAAEWHSCGEQRRDGHPLVKHLREDLGLTLRGLAVAGTGLDVPLTWGDDGQTLTQWVDETAHQASGVPEVVLGRGFPVARSSPNYLTPRAAQLKCWSRLTEREFDCDEAPLAAHVQPELDAALLHPRLAALVLQHAEFRCRDGELSMALLHECLPAAIEQFARLSVLPGLSSILDPSTRPPSPGIGERLPLERALDVRLACLRLALYPAHGARNANIDEMTRSVIADGVAALKPENGRVRVSIGAAERLLLRRLFTINQAPRTGPFDGFTTAFGHFVCFAAVASRGKTVAEFTDSLNAFFSHSSQFKGSESGTASRGAAPAVMRAPEGMGPHVLHAGGAQMVRLRPYEYEVFGGRERYAQVCLTRTKLKRSICSKLSPGDVWNVKLLLPVTPPGELNPDSRYKDVEFTFQTVPHTTEGKVGEAVPLNTDGVVWVVGGLRGEESVSEPRSVWHVNVSDPGSLCTVPFPSPAAEVMDDDDDDDDEEEEEQEA